MALYAPYFGTGEMDETASVVHISTNAVSNGPTVKLVVRWYPREPEMWDGCWHAPKEAQQRKTTRPSPMKQWVELKPKSPSSLWHRFIQRRRE